jgi:hypothetical protein
MPMVHVRARRMDEGGKNKRVENTSGRYECDSISGVAQSTHVVGAAQNDALVT